MQLFADRLPALTKMQPALNGRMTFFAAGLSHKTAPVELRERLAVNVAQLGHCASRLKLCAGLDEIVMLSTCNRVEIYGTTSQGTIFPDSLFKFLCAAPLDFSPHVYFHEDIEALRHLFSVAAGLDSMVLGETEITGQVKKAYDLARATSLTGGTLNRVFQRAFQTAKEIRTRTGIGRGATSIGSVAVELVEKIFQHDLSKRSIVIIGAGAMGEAVVRHLAKKGARSILVSNRSFDHAVELAAQFGGRAVKFKECLAALADADIAVVSTGCPTTLLHRADVEKLMAARGNRPLVLIDISVPRNIEDTVQRVENVYLYNIDDLEAIVGENTRTRSQQLASCHQIINARAEALMAKLKLEKERLLDAGVQSKPGWFPHGALALSGS
jgi:glutamyl-tRNA reductase